MLASSLGGWSHRDCLAKTAPTTDRTPSCGTTTAEKWSVWCRACSFGTRRCSSRKWKIVVCCLEFCRPSSLGRAIAMVESYMALEHMSLGAGWLNTASWDCSRAMAKKVQTVWLAQYTRPNPLICLIYLVCPLAEPPSTPRNIPGLKLKHSNEKNQEMLFSPPPEVTAPVRPDSSAGCQRAPSRPARLS
jgi:hypothetical protein